MCRLDVVFLILALFMALPASAQVREVAPDQTTPQRRPPARPARPAAPSDVLRAYFLVEGTEMLAANTFDAVLGTTRVYGRGGGGEALGLWKGVFARVAFSVARETGDRVVISPDNEALPVGIPVTVDLQPIEIGIGWRSRLGRSGRLVGYAGASGLLLRYRERSQFGGDEDDTDTTYRGGAGFAGLEVLLGGWVIAGAEAQYRTVPDAIGAGGVSKAFGDTDLGGITVRILVGIRH